MKYADFLARLEEAGNLRNYVYNHYKKKFLKACKIIESIPDEKINEILQSGDVIRRISVMTRLVDGNKKCFWIEFFSSLHEDDYSIYIPANDSDYSEYDNDDRVEILVMDHAIEIYAENFTFLESEHSAEKLKNALGDDYICSDTQTITVRNTFFD